MAGIKTKTTQNIATHVQVKPSLLLQKEGGVYLFFVFVFLHILSFPAILSARCGDTDNYLMKFIVEIAELVKTFEY